MSAARELTTVGTLRSSSWPRVARAAVRSAPFALVVAIASALGAYGVVRALPPTYIASVGLISSQPAMPSTAFGVFVPPPVDAAVYRSAVLEGDIVPNVLAGLMGARPSDADVKDLLERLTVRVEEAEGSGTVWIEVRDRSPDMAAALVNAIAAELVTWDRMRGQRAIERSIAAIEGSLSELFIEIQSATAAGAADRVVTLNELAAQRDQELTAARDTLSDAFVVGLLEPLRTAAPPTNRVGLGVPLTVALAAVLGLVLGYATLHGLRTLDPRVGDRREVAERTGLPVLAVFASLALVERAANVEAAHFLHGAVDGATRGFGFRTILVTSPASPSEKVETAVDLAESFARSGQRTLLVDADLRHAGATESFDLVPNSVEGFEAILATDGPRRALVRVLMPGGRSFDLVPSWRAPRVATELLIQGFESHVRAWSEAYDVVVIDAPPVVPFADALVMAQKCTGVLMCVSKTRSRRDELDDAIVALRRTDVPLLGVVLTDGSPPRGFRRKDMNPRRSRDDRGHKLRLRTKGALD
ncbi:MAG: CpsD/CapB family tyrosine-protein kinase [Thioalkalivibrio sp.]|nr:CpsD/CapB family tyrosine-protein kinase [Thioalkalivibrio sp.]